MSTIKLIKLPHLKIHNANALSSPFTIGFPAMTAWLGFMHALERKLQQGDLAGLIFKSLAVISHECDLQTYRGPNDFVHSIIGTGNPLDKDGSRSAFIEEARCHLDVSLLIEYDLVTEESDRNLSEDNPIFDTLSELILTMKLAGGDILSVGKANQYILSESDESGKTKLRMLNSLMPGYVLIERRDLVVNAMNEGQDAMDAILDYVTVHHQCITTENDDQPNQLKFEWKAQRKTSGWLVPIATGFQGISPLGKAKNQRDPDVSHLFAESVVTLGQFVMVNKIEHPDDMLWEYKYHPTNNLYLCEQVGSKYFTTGE